MEKKICLFKETPITFVIDRNNNMMINATEMAKPYGKKVNDFMSNASTIKFIECIIQNNKYLNINVASKKDIIYSVQKKGTWMHRMLAFEFASWLSYDFKLWIMATAEKLLLKGYMEREKSFIRTIKLQNEMNELLGKKEKTGEDFKRYIEIEKELKIEKAYRKELTISSISEIKRSI